MFIIDDGPKFVYMSEIKALLDGYVYGMGTGPVISYHGLMEIL